MRSKKKHLLLALIALLAAVLLVGGGFALGASPSVRGALKGVLPSAVTSGQGTGVSYALQDKVLRDLEDSYYQAVDPAALETDAISGMVAGLNDPYTVYLDPQDYASLNEDLSGSYSGVGMAVEMKDGFVTLTTVFKGTPAALAGIQPGDIIVSIDGASTASLSLDQAVAKIQGKSGTTVILGLYRPGASFASTATTTTVTTSVTTSPAATASSPSLLPPGGTTSDYSLVRQTIAIPAVDTEILDANGEKVAHISLYAFSQGSAAALRAQVKQAVETDKVSAIVLDLRGNGGGLVNEGVGVASIFIPQGVIVTTQGLHSPKVSYSATGEAYDQIPLYVLVDRYTASASEIVSGALQDYKRATLIGETTFGKGLVQTITPLSNGGAVKVTIAEYLTPQGRDINKKGITPDVVAASTPSTPNVDQVLQEALGLIGSSGTGK